MFVFFLLSFVCGLVVDPIGTNTPKHEFILTYPYKTKSTSNSTATTLLNKYKNLLYNLDTLNDTVIMQKINAAKNSNSTQSSSSSPPAVTTNRTSLDLLKYKNNISLNGRNYSLFNVTQSDTVADNDTLNPLLSIGE